MMTHTQRKAEEIGERVLNFEFGFVTFVSRGRYNRNTRYYDMDTTEISVRYI